MTKILKGMFLLCGLCAFVLYVISISSPKTNMSVENESSEIVEGSDQSVAEDSTDATDDTKDTAGEDSDSSEQGVSKEEVQPEIDENITYVGIYDSGENDIVKYYKESLNMIGVFEELDGSATGDYKLEQGLDEGYFTPFITLQISDMDLNGFAAGTYDQELQTFFNRVTMKGRKDKTVYVRLAHEMELETRQWYSWQTLDASQYIEAWRYIVTMGRELAPNVQWVWSPNKATDWSAQYYPGDDYVDCVGITSNLFKKYMKSYSTFEKFYEKQGERKLLEAYGKPIFLGECGCASEDKEMQREYLLDAIEYAQNDGNIKGVVLLDKSTDKRPYRFSDDATTMKEIMKKVEGAQD